MHQLALDMTVDVPRTLESFVSGANTELVTLLRAMADRTSKTKFVTVWGGEGTGKSHLLTALSSYGPTLSLSPESNPSDFVFTRDVTLYLLDDVHLFDEERQIAAFHLFNAVRDSADTFMVCTVSTPPAMLSLRDELKSRLSWDIVYQIKPLTDEEKTQALTLEAHRRGIKLSAGVIPYLISHCRRDMHSLFTVFNALDAYAYETKRAITLPLLHELLEPEHG